MAKGRRPAPQALKQKRGTARKDRAPKKPVTTTVSKPINKAPSFLKAKGKLMYERSVSHLHSMGLLSQIDDTALELLAMAYQEWYSAELKLQKEGRIYETFSSNGAKVLKAHPAAAQSADAWRRIRMMLIEFGLTPASRSKLERPEGRTLDIDDIIEM